MNLPEYQPRRPYQDDKPNGYMESDRDYLLNNRHLAIALLDEHGRKMGKLGDEVEIPKELT